MRWPRSVTLTPIGMPVRSLNCAIDAWRVVTIGFWPVIDRQVADGGVERLGVLDRLAQADVDDHLLQLRHLHGVRVAELAHQRRHRPRRGSAGAAAAAVSGARLVPRRRLAGFAAQCSAPPSAAACAVCGRGFACVVVTWPPRSARRSACRRARGVAVLEELCADPGRLVAAAGRPASRCETCSGTSAGRRFRPAACASRGRWCRLAMLTPWTTTRHAGSVRALDRACHLSSRLPRSLPASTITVSLFAARLPSRAPPARATRSSCSSARAARAPPGRRCGCRAGSPCGVMSTAAFSSKRMWLPSGRRVLLGGAHDDRAHDLALLDAGRSAAPA